MLYFVQSFDLQLVFQAKEAKVKVIIHIHWQGFHLHLFPLLRNKSSHMTKAGRHMMGVNLVFGVTF